jgi:hypothetical protein
MSELRIVIVKTGGGYLKAIVPDRQETSYGRDEREIVDRPKFRKNACWMLVVRGK